MPEWEITTYKDAMDRAEKDALGCITGHHLIPDHCLMFAKGLRNAGSAFTVPGAESYRTNSAPVILLTADIFGGKTRMHGEVHAVFDPIEDAVVSGGSGMWTYAAVRQAAIDSVIRAAKKWSVAIPWTASTLQAQIDAYFVTHVGLTDATWLRAGEHTAPAQLHKKRGGTRSHSAKIAVALAPKKLITKKAPAKNKVKKGF